jgi:protein-S-isoprenylcysteine O-methyltransferase Ste14
MLLGFIQSVPFIIVIVVFFSLDIWFAHRFTPKLALSEKRDNLADFGLIAVALIIIIQPVVFPWLGLQINAWWGLVVQAIGIACSVSGLIIYVWIRINLREYFSEKVEIQPGHQLVRSGPYGLVRHPMYTTFILLMLGQLLVKPALFEAIGFVFVIWHFVTLAKDEDALLSKELAGYLEYMEITPGFLPRL